METIEEGKERKSQDTHDTVIIDTATTTTDEDENDDDSLTRRLEKIVINISSSNPTESIGHRNVRAHRRVQSTTLFSILDSPRNMRHRVRSLSLAECPAPSLDKYYPGSHLLDSTNAVVDGNYSTNTIYLSLWLLPPLPMRKNLLKDIAKLAMRYSAQGSSAPFMPHVTVIGSIACGSVREVNELGVQLQKSLECSGPVPCRFDRTRGCVAMYKEDDRSPTTGGNTKRSLVWSQSCIAVMERSEEFMNLLALSRQVLKLPPGECTCIACIIVYCFSLDDSQKLTASFLLPDRDVSGPNL
jgi:hypothetical protein